MSTGPDQYKSISYIYPFHSRYVTIWIRTQDPLIDTERITSYLEIIANRD